MRIIREVKKAMRNQLTRCQPQHPEYTSHRALVLMGAGDSLGGTATSNLGCVIYRGVSVTMSSKYTFSLYGIQNGEISYLEDSRNPRLSI